MGISLLYNWLCVCLTYFTRIGFPDPQYKSSFPISVVVFPILVKHFVFIYTLHKFIKKKLLKKKKKKNNNKNLSKRSTGGQSNFYLCLMKIKTLLLTQIVSGKLSVFRKARSHISPLAGRVLQPTELLFNKPKSSWEMELTKRTIEANL